MILILKKKHDFMTPANFCVETQSSMKKTLISLSYKEIRKLLSVSSFLSNFQKDPQLSSVYTMMTSNNIYYT